jgi:hypothetical protein
LVLDTTPYTKYVKPMRRVHLYTLIQLFFFVLLYAVKNYKKISISFPLFILLCIPVRIYLLPKIFSDDELTLLDGSPEEIEEWILNKTEINDEVVRVITNHGDSDDAALAGALKKNIDDDDDDDDDDDTQERTSASTSNNNGSNALDHSSENHHQSREKQESTSSVGSFFARRQRQRREKQTSSKSQGSVGGGAQSIEIEEYMKQNGLTMPSDKMGGGDDCDGRSDSGSELSDNIEC